MPTIVADSAKAMLMCEPGHLPVYYLPFDDIRMDLMQRTDQSTVCPHKGSAVYWNLTVDGRTAENALWAYPEPYDHAPPGIKDYAAFYWNKVDHWYEEESRSRKMAWEPSVMEYLPSLSRVSFSMFAWIGSARSYVMGCETGVQMRLHSSSAL